MFRRFKPADSHIKAVVGKWVNDHVAAGGWPTPEQFEEFLKCNVNDSNRSIFCCPGKDSVTRLNVLAVRTRLQHLKKSSDLRAEVSFHVYVYDIEFALLNINSDANLLLSPTCRGNLGGIVLARKRRNSFTLRQNQRKQGVAGK